MKAKKSAMGVLLSTMMAATLLGGCGNETSASSDSGAVTAGGTESGSGSGETQQVALKEVVPIENSTFRFNWCR